MLSAPPHVDVIDVLMRSVQQKTCAHGVRGSPRACSRLLPVIPYGWSLQGTGSAMFHVQPEGHA